jgi:peptidoglycan hydrolase CwlO-like protein
MIISSAFTEINSAIYGTVGALLAGALIQLANKFLNRKKDKLEEHLSLRKELREELDAVKHELNELQKALDEWKEKYYHQVEVTNELKMEVQKLTDEIEEYKNTGIYPIVKKPFNDD